MVRSGIQGAETGKKRKLHHHHTLLPGMQHARSGEKHKKCLELLPEKGRIVHLPEKKDLTQYDSADCTSKPTKTTPSFKPLDTGL